MRLVIFPLLFALAATATWAQRYPKHPGNGVAPDGTVRQQVRLHISSLRSHPHLKAAQSPPPAAGVAQCYVDPNGVLSGDFVNTSTIPSGSFITGSITLLDDGSSIDFTGESLTSSLPAGSYSIAHHHQLRRPLVFLGSRSRYCRSNPAAARNYNGGGLLPAGWRSFREFRPCQQ